VALCAAPDDEKGGALMNQAMNQIHKAAFAPDHALNGAGECAGCGLFLLRGL
jgi:hypothetical protein